MRHPSASRSRNVLHLQMYSIRWSATSIPHATHTTQVNIAMCTHTWHIARKIFYDEDNNFKKMAACTHPMLWGNLCTQCGATISGYVGITSQHSMLQHHLYVRSSRPVPLSGLPKSAAALQRLGRVFTRYTYRAGTNAQHEESNPT